MCKQFPLGRRRLLVAIDKVPRDARGVFRLQFAEAFDQYRRELAVLLHLRRPPGRKDQVADALSRIEQRGDRCRRGDRTGRVNGRSEQKRFQIGHFV